MLVRFAKRSHHEFAVERGGVGIVGAILDNEGGQAEVRVNGNVRNAVVGKLLAAREADVAGVVVKVDGAGVGCCDVEVDARLFVDEQILFEPLFGGAVF